jgi:hypothetical protein
LAPGDSATPQPFEPQEDDDVQHATLYGPYDMAVAKYDRVKIGTDLWLVAAPPAHWPGPFDGEPGGTVLALTKVVA